MIEQPEVKIKQAREVKRVSQDFVAAQLGISTRAYSKIESGETQLTITRLNEICAILQVDPMKVLGFDDKKVFNINHNEYHLNQIPEKLIAQYEETIAPLKEQIVMLKEMLNK